MTPGQWARVLRAGERGAQQAQRTVGIPPPALVLRQVLGAMAGEAEKISEETQ